MLATIIGFTGAMILGTAIAAALWWWHGLYKVLDPYLVVANAMPKTAFVPIFYIWLGATLSIYAHVARDLAVRHHPHDLQRLPGHRSRTRSSSRRPFGASKGQILDQGGSAGQRADADRGAQGERRAVARRRRGRRIPVGQFGLGYLIQYGSQIFKMNIVMTAITILAIVSSVMYLAISWLEAAVMRRR